MHFFFSFFIWVGLVQMAYAQTPTHLVASYRKYHNRIELTWQATGSDHLYVVQRRESARKAFVLLDTVLHNRYVDRNGLQANMDYWYCVQSILPNGQRSARSVEAKGAILAVANGRLGSVDSAQQAPICMQFTVIEAKCTAKTLSFVFLAKPICTQPAAVPLTFYFSEDGVLDDKDTPLGKQVFAATRRRGAFNAPNAKQIRTGYLLMEVGEGVGASVVAKALRK